MSKLAVFQASLLVSGLLSMSHTADAATATTTMPVTMTVTAGCQITAGTVAFGSTSGLFSAVAANSALSVTCTNTTPYVVGLDAGSGSGATTTSRKMTGPSASTIVYRLYQNSGLTMNFGNSSGSDTVAGTGSGTVQTINVYGQVPAQASPQPGSYSDIVNVTLTY